MSAASRLPLDPATHLPSINSFGGLSQFLRAASADEESRQVSASMGELATHVEAIVAALRLDRSRAAVAPLLVDLLTVLRTHRQLVVNLAPAWRGLYEYAGYLQALNHFRVLIGQWLLDGGPRSAQLALTAEDFELVAWRTLGEGMLMIDMYEQWVSGELVDTVPSAPASLPASTTLAQQPVLPSMPPAAAPPQVERALQWWKKLRL